MSLAWHVAALTRMNKKFPKLEKLLVKADGPQKPVQSMAQQIMVARMWSAMGYGKITKPKG